LVRTEERRILLAGAAAIALAAALLIPALYQLGLRLAPARPDPAAIPRTTGLMRAAIWARADGGPTTTMRPLTVFSFIGHRVCRALASRHDDATARAEGRAACLHEHPGIEAADALAGVHLRAQAVNPHSFRTGLGHVSTAAWMSRNWTAETLMDALAAIGNFGYGWRGATAASTGYFSKPVEALAPEEAALLATIIENRRQDPWCNAAGALDSRNRVLRRMLGNGVIDEPSVTRASLAPLHLAPRPAGPPCESTTP